MKRQIKKYQIKGLKKSIPLQDASKLILDAKLKEVYILINKYFEDSSEFNLHKLRISIRKFRYFMETVYLCIDDKQFTYVHRKIKHLLNILGEGRDQDVLIDKLMNIASDEKKIDVNEVLNAIKNTQLPTRQKIKKELLTFICDKNVNSFFNKNKIR